jgi:hypothetical protein
LFYPQTKVERSKAYQLQDERIGNPVPLHVNQGRVTFSRGIKRIGQTIVEPLNKAPKDMTVVSDACRGTSPVASNSEVTRGSSEASTGPSTVGTSRGSSRACASSLLNPRRALMFMKLWLS